LRLDNNFIESLSDLSALTRLEKLSVRNNKLKSVEGLHRLQWLSHLDISSNLLPKFDVEGLCPSLEVLDISLNKLQSLDSIQRYTLKLKELNVQQNPLEKDSNGRLMLSRFPELMNLRIDGYLERVIEGLEEDCVINGKFIFKSQPNTGISQMQKSIEGKLTIKKNEKKPKNEEQMIPITPVHSLKPIEVIKINKNDNEAEFKIIDKVNNAQFKKNQNEVKESKS
jgi:Leucine-rich repeat (LRR) protein